MAKVAHNIHCNLTKLSFASRCRETVSQLARISKPCKISQGAGTNQVARLGRKVANLEVGSDKV
jgi:hypothetical protein